MKIYDDRSPTEQEEIWRRLLLRWLPMLGTCPLLLVVQGGIPPATWRQLLHVYLLLGTLTTQEQKTIFLPLYILVIQMLLLVGAWGLYLRLVVREGIGVWHMLAAKNREASTTSSPKEDTPSRLAQPVLIATSPAQGAAQRPGRTARYEQTPLLSAPRNDAALANLFGIEEPKPDPALDNPFEVKEPSRPATSPPALSVSAVNRYKRMRIERNESEAQMVIIQPNIIHEEQAAVLRETTDKFKAILSQLGCFPPEKPQAAELAPARQAQPGPDETVPDEPPDKTTLQRLLEQAQPYPYEFRVQPPSSPEAAGQNNSKPDTTWLARQPAEFVYGNPFDAPLPDVFQEDEDLKRLAGEQRTSAVLPAMKASEQIEATPDKKVSPLPSESGPAIIYARRQRLSADSGGRRRRVPSEDPRKMEQQS